MDANEQELETNSHVVLDEANRMLDVKFDGHGWMLNSSSDESKNVLRVRFARHESAEEAE